MLEISRQELARKHNFPPGELEVGRYKLGELLKLLQRLRATYCKSKYMRRYYRMNIEKKLAHQRRYYREHREQCLMYQREYKKRQKALQADNPNPNG